MYQVKYSKRFDKNLKLCAKRGLNMQLIFEAIHLGVPHPARLADDVGAK